ncbi:hypothetical protein F66182_9462 [Fusarium sp. NRRL 66182]|nr:hypothetical protein F66182_9462 [Fusarium sp. NRRL 66182]
MALDMIRNLWSSPSKHPTQKPSSPPMPAPSRTYSKKDIQRAKRGLERIGKSAARGPRSRLSNVSSTASIHDTTVTTRGDTTLVSEKETTINMTPAPPAATKSRRTRTPPGSRPSPDLGFDPPFPPSSATQASSSFNTAAQDKQAQPPSPRSQLEQAEEEEQFDESTGEVKRMTDFRWDGDEIEMRVEWQDGTFTWEPEHTMHADVPEILFAFWDSRGGRPTNADNDQVYQIFKICNHRTIKGTPKLQVEWVGYRKEYNTWEPRDQIQQDQPEVVDQYFASVKKTPGRRKRRSRPTMQPQAALTKHRVTKNSNK